MYLLYLVIYYCCAAFRPNAPCVGHKVDESQAQGSRGSTGNLSLTACFADIKVSQSSVATYARCGGIFNIHLSTNLPRTLSVNFLKIISFDRIMVMS